MMRLLNLLAKVIKGPTVLSLSIWLSKELIASSMNAEQKGSNLVNDT